MMSLWVFSAACLLTTAAICLACIFDRRIDDGLIERVGMVVLVFACLGRAKDIIAAGTVNPIWVSVHAGMAIYALGVFLRLVLKHMRYNGWPPILRFDAWASSRRWTAMLRKTGNHKKDGEFRF